MTYSCRSHYRKLSFFALSFFFLAFNSKINDQSRNEAALTGQSTSDVKKDNKKGKKKKSKSRKRHSSSSSSSDSSDSSESSSNESSSSSDSSSSSGKLMTQYNNTQRDEYVNAIVYLFA